MDESRHSLRNKRKYTYEDLSNRDDHASYGYDQNVWEGEVEVHRNVAMNFTRASNLYRHTPNSLTFGKPSTRNIISRTLQPPILPNDSPPSDSGVYYRLPTKNSIRLLEILPGTRSTPIASRIHVTQLDDPRPYEALSYVWGQKESYHKVRVNNDDVDATPNLFHALERIRLQDRERFIWVDQLCINQSDKDEKGNQVQLMNRIYKTASRVLVWLGKDDTSTPNTAFGLICEVVNYFSKSAKASFTSSGNIKTMPVSDTLPKVDSQRWLPLQKLFDLNWFWRVWIIQEIALSAAASLMWDDAEIEWECVGLAAAYIRINKSNLLEHCFMPGIFNAYFMYRISITADTIFKPVSLCFLSLLTMTQQYDTSENLDRVYGLLGLPSTNSGPDGRPFIEPNYNLDIQDVYRAVALRIIETNENLSLLSSVQHGPDFRSSQESWESWVPKWDITVFTKSLLSGDSAHRHKADGEVPMV